MVNNDKIHRLTFTITPNANGYVVGCDEIPSLFTDTNSFTNIDDLLKNLVVEYVENFPDDASKRGVYKEIPIQAIWRAAPNSVALE